MYRWNRWSASNGSTSSTVIPSEFAPLLDVLTISFKVQADKVLDKSGCAHALFAEVADNPVQLVTYRLTDEHRLAVDNLGDLEIGGAVLIQRQPALLATDSLLWHCHISGLHT